MSTLTDVGHLMYLYMEEIEAGNGTDAPEFLINTAAQILVKNGGRNWLPVIVIETKEDCYQVIGNFFTYAVVEAAGLERVWCVIAENSQEAQEITQLLARETIPKINLNQMTVAQLKNLAKQKGLKGYSNLRKAELIKRLNQ